MKLRTIEPRDNAAVAAIIRTVMPEFGAKGPGFAINDPEVDSMYEAYSRSGAAYFVLENEAALVVGGGGVAPLEAGDEGVCELRKMYFLPEARGGGFGKRVLELCIERARELGYKRMYLETLSGMDAAVHLYERFGFAKLCAPLGNTGHFSCDRYYARDL
jgi:putative acetyltransferase